jgi:hypothetical protein
MPASQPLLPEPVDVEWIAAEWLIEQGEVTLADDCAALDRLSDAALADQMVTQWRDRLGNVDFDQVVAAFRWLRSE